MASFPHLRVFLEEVKQVAAAEQRPVEEVFASLLKSKHYWPALQWKKYNDASGLILLHNTYKRTDVAEFQALYDECRSVVLDLHAPENETIVISMANTIPERMTYRHYETQMTPEDVCHISYEGTVISVYLYQNTWHFSTSSCPSVNRSRYTHPTKKHGTMLNETLAAMFNTSEPTATSSEPTATSSEPTATSTEPTATSSEPTATSSEPTATSSEPTATSSEPAATSTEPTALEEARALRERFTAQLNPDHVYYFLLVHHENSYRMNYTAEFGPQYKKLIHIMTRDKKTQETIALTDTPFGEAPWNKAIVYSRVFASPAQALEWAQSSSPSVDGEPVRGFGLMVQRPDGKLWKVASQEMLYREEEDLGNPNPWMNMLWVYVQNRPHYHVNNYIEKYCPNIEFPVDQFGRTLAPVYILHTVICTIRDCIYQSYRYTTKYYPEYNRWKMNKTLDEALPKILRFHLSQLRNIQVTTHQGEYLTPNTIYHYLCHHQSMSNLLKLIAYFADPRENAFNLTARTLECFQVLHRLLTNK